MTHSVSSLALEVEELTKLRELEAAGRFRLREEEMRECTAMGLTPTQVIQRSLSYSIEASMVFADEDLVVIWGHGPQNRCAGTGSAWMVTTPKILKHKLRFIRSSLMIVNYLMTVYNRLEVLVSTQYLESIHWLEWLGFKVHPVAFEIEKESVFFMWKER